MGSDPGLSMPTCLSSLVACSLLKGPEFEPLRWKEGHFTKYHKDHAAHMFASRLKVVLEQPRVDKDDLDAQGGWLVEAPVRHTLQTRSPCEKELASCGRSRL